MQHAHGKTHICACALSELHVSGGRFTSLLPLLQNFKFYIEIGSPDATPTRKPTRPTLAVAGAHKLEDFGR